jgi:AcrR family transcriptional regulator
MPGKVKFDLFPDEPATTREAIMKATYDALCEHGYADLTIQRIGDHFEKSKSLLYHHYDSKDALLVDFMGFMLEQMEADVPIEETGDAHEQLQFAIGFMFLEMIGGHNDGFLQAMIEMRAQASHDDAYRERFTANDDYLIERYVDIIEEGIEAGVFRDVDPEPVAKMIFTTIGGAMTRYITSDDPDMDTVHEELLQYVRARLLPEDAADAA